VAIAREKLLQAGRGSRERSSLQRGERRGEAGLGQERERESHGRVTRSAAD
jgi:hypothetical protein